jgi:hypothetical protein
MNIIYLDLINPKWLCTSKHCILQPYAILYVNLKNIKLVKVTQDDNYDIKFTNIHTTKTYCIIFMTYNQI